MNLHIAQFSVLSEPGRRPHNEDAVYPNALLSATAVPNLYIIADGIGGKGKGDAASRITIESFAQYFSQNPPAEEALTRVYVDNALRFAENAFDEYIKVHPECWGMGATVVLLYMNSVGASIAWAGNCRAYHYRKAEQLYRSNDHTEVNVLLRDGRITADEAQIHPRRHSILRAIQGSSYPTQMDTHFIGNASIFPGDVFFLCSDGILEGISESHLSTAIDLQANTDLLLTEIKTYCQAESSDNYACAILRIEDKDAVATPPTAAPLIAAGTSPVVWDDDDDDFIEVAEVELVIEDEPETEPLLNPTVVNAPIVVPPVVSDTPPLVEKPLTVESPQVSTPQVNTPPHAEMPYIQPPIVLNNNLNSNNIPPASGNHLSEEKKDNSGMLALAVLLFTGILVALLAWAWSGSGKGKHEKSYQDYMALATESRKTGDFDKAILYLDSATMINKGASSGDSRMRIELVEQKRAADKAKMLAQGDKFAAFNKYPDYIRAINTYEDAKRNYGDNGGIIDGKIAKAREEMAKLAPATAFQDLLVEANNMCKEGNTLDANVFMEAAMKFKSTPAEQKALNELKGQCSILANAAHNGEKVETTVAANERSVGERTVANPINGTNKPSDANVKKSASPEPKTREINSSAAVVENGGIGKNAATTGTNPTARKAAPATAIVTADMSNLQKGKAYFRDALNRKNCDSYESALRFLEKSYAAKQLDGEGAYMAAYICHDGHCDLDNAKKALEYANRSAFLEYTNGQYLYGKLLLNKKSHSDSALAHGYLTKATAKGHKEAKVLQQKLWKKK